MKKPKQENNQEIKTPINEVNKPINKDQVKALVPKKGLSKRTIWTIKITGITLCLALVVSFITEITSSKSDIFISIILLCILVLISILSDAIGVSATSCDLAPLLSMAARKVKGAKVAVLLVQNAEKVSNICADVIGDMCGIISGSCSAAIVLKFALDNPNMYIYNIIISSVVVACTVGGKAFFKSIAMKNSREIIMFASKAISIFYRPKK
jgi:hypothetical protein